ncbi:MAG: SAM-dependent DNA methyltransferase, partial [Novosphingobium sp.]
DVRSHGHVLTPGRYVGAADVEDDGVSFEERFGALRTKLAEQFNSGRALEERIKAALELVQQ